MRRGASRQLGHVSPTGRPQDRNDRWSPANSKPNSSSMRVSSSSVRPGAIVTVPSSGMRQSLIRKWPVVSLRELVAGDRPPIAMLAQNQPFAGGGGYAAFEGVDDFTVAHRPRSDHASPSPDSAADVLVA
ncbi:hypothetical protein MHPYR_40020 [uncultured Mycobacterium sp.]|uniref:Uncharacterized protein n=1 Tax=uncultured Mycobacterium sp. TaxID=171292 RepID=A0A1Y5PM83_9MYCO|nr:hypothetical protein MHPYR_40020 [uncultured Mycobacterium sp.]